jgi:hypothetical protein
VGAPPGQVNEGICNPTLTRTLRGVAAGPEPVGGVVAAGFKVSTASGWPRAGRRLRARAIL